VDSQAGPSVAFDVTGDRVIHDGGVARASMLENDKGSVPSGTAKGFQPTRCRQLRFLCPA
jgi:hypothetical protein